VLIKNKDVILWWGVGRSLEDAVQLIRGGE